MIRKTRTRHCLGAGDARAAYGDVAARTSANAEGKVDK